MSKLAEFLRSRQLLAATLATSATPEPESSKSSEGSRGSEQNTHLERLAAEREDFVHTLSAAQESARQEVLAQLEAHPAVKRHFVTRWEDDALIVTLAIHGVGTGELMISADKIGRDDLKAYAAILDCLDGLKS